MAFFIFLFCNFLIETTLLQSKSSLAANVDSKLKIEQQLWNEVQELSNTHQYSKAIQKLQENPISHSSYYFNLGILYFNQGEKILGLGYLEKAALMDTHDSEIREQVDRALEILQIPQTHSSFVDRLSLDEIRGALGFLGFILLISWIRTLLKRKKLKIVFFQPSSLILSSALLLTLSLYFLQRWGERHPLAISLQNEILKSGPGEDYSNLPIIRSGEHLRILNSQYSNENPSEIWYQIRYSSQTLISKTQGNKEETMDSKNLVGWIKKQSLFIISD